MEVIKRIIREGKCTFCGACCKSVVLNLHTDPNRSDNDMRVNDYCLWLDHHNVPHKKYPDKVEIIVGGPCKHLIFDHGRAKCMIYDKRPLVCKEFPTQQTPLCIGFTFTEQMEEPAKEPDKKEDVK